jgi:hypothetical protein
MKTQLPNEIKTIEDAKAFLTDLHTNNETFHPEDDATDIEWQTCVVSEIEAIQLNKLMGDIYALPGNSNSQNMAFCPCEFLLMLDPEYVKMLEEDV